MAKRSILLAIVFVFVAGALAQAQFFGGSMSTRTPEVRYIFPKDESTTDLTDKKTLVFRWKPVPIPAGERSSYKFELFKGFGYDRIEDVSLSPDVFFVEIPAEKFADDTTYTWQVKQRDQTTMNWSHCQRWSFLVKR